MKMIEEDYKRVWAECLEVIKDTLGPENRQAYETWFTPIVPLKLEGSTLLVQVPSQFFYEWIEENYIDLLRRVIRMHLGPGAMLKYSIVMDQTIPNEPLTTQLPSQPRRATRNPLSDLPVNLNKDNARELPNPFVIPGIQKTRIPSQLNPNYTLDAVNYMRESFGTFEYLVKKRKLRTFDQKKAYMAERDFRRMTEQDPEVWNLIFANMEKADA